MPQPFDEIRLLLNAVDVDAENVMRPGAESTAAIAASLGISRLARTIRLLTDHLDNSGESS